jgi:hypothetical protein
MKYTNIFCGQCAELLNVTVIILVTIFLRLKEITKPVG